MPNETPRLPSEADNRVQSLIQAAIDGKRIKDNGRNSTEVDSFLKALKEELQKGLFELSDQNLQRIISIASQNEEGEFFEAVILLRIEQRFPGASIEQQQYDSTGTSWEVVYSEGGRVIHRPIADVLAECRQ